MIFRLVHAMARERALQAVREAPEGWMVRVTEPTRNLDQNAALWPILEKFSEQLAWPVNGRMVQMEPEEWKDVLTAAFRSETVRLAQGLHGGVVMLGLRTSKMSKREFSEFLDFIQAVGTERGIQWSDERQCSDAPIFEKQ